MLMRILCIRALRLKMLVVFELLRLRAGRVTLVVCNVEVKCAILTVCVTNRSHTRCCPTSHARSDSSSTATVVVTSAHGHN